MALQTVPKRLAIRQQLLFNFPTEETFGTYLGIPGALPGSKDTHSAYVEV